MISDNPGDLDSYNKVLDNDSLFVLQLHVWPHRQFRLQKILDQNPFPFESSAIYLFGNKTY